MSLAKRRHQFVDDRLLETGDQVKGRLRRDGDPFLDGGRRGGLPAGGDFRLDGMRFRPAQHRGFEAGKGEIQRVALHVGAGEADAFWVAVGREFVEDRTAGIGEAEELGDLVIGLAGRVVAGTADELVFEVGAHVVEVRVPSADDERERRQGRLWMFKDHGVYMALQVVHGDERDAVREADGLGVGDADQERSDEPGAAGDGHSADVAPCTAASMQSFFHDGRDGPHMFPAGQFRHYTAVFLVGFDL